MTPAWVTLCMLSDRRDGRISLHCVPGCPQRNQRHWRGPALAEGRGSVHDFHGQGYAEHRITLEGSMGREGGGVGVRPP